jgi:hypothetical protein
MSFIVNPLPAIELGKDTTICHGSKLVLHAGKNYAIYRWNDNSQKDSLNVKASGKYSVTVTDNIGCVNRDSVTVKLDDMKVELGKDDSICSGSSVLLDAGISPATYRWNDDSKQKTLNVSKAGTYKVTVTDEYKCVSADSVKIFIYQAVKVNLGKDRTINNDSSIVLHAGGGYKSYVWQDGSTDSTLNVNKKGQYIVTVTTFEDCVNSDTVNIEVTCFSKDVFVPDVFTPGNSSSICNSYFRMQGRCIGDAELQVFNRWGAKVYDNTYNFTGQGDASVCNNTSHQDIVGNFSKMYYYLLWDGRDKSNGNLLAQGLYYYILNYNIMDEDVISRRVKKGSVVIVR